MSDLGLAGLAVSLAAILAFAVVRVRRRWEHRTLTDTLTGLPNRRMFDIRVDHALLRARRHGFRLAVMSIDVDELASVNHMMGRECGDTLLRDVAARLRGLARAEDTVARIGSDEFAILLEQVEDSTGAARAARRILDTFLVPVTIEGRAVATSVSIGLSMDTASSTSDSLLREAGIARDRAKARGKRRFETYEPPMGVEAAERFQLEAELQQMHARDELVVHYQPMLDVTTGTVIGAEALARWAHPSRGLLQPADFVPVAEETGAIVELGRAILMQSCRAAATIAAHGVPHFGISVNVSPRQFHDCAGLLADVAAALRDSRLPPDLLTLEITESSLLDDVAAAADVVRNLRELRVNVVLDDFGTGFSSLSYIKDIPVTGLKLDKSFVDGLDEQKTTTIIRAILEIARDFGISATAEGVETEEQSAKLRALGCRFMQGHYYCSAIPEGALLRTVTRRFPQRATHGSGHDAGSALPPRQAAS